MKHKATNPTHTPSTQKGAKFQRIVTNPDVIESFPGVLLPRKTSSEPSRLNLSQTPPAGYSLVNSGVHLIGLRDLVFMGGGQHSFWQPARRAGELGSLCRDSVAMSVAVLDQMRGKSCH